MSISLLITTINILEIRMFWITFPRKKYQKSSNLNFTCNSHRAYVFLHVGLPVISPRQFCAIEKSLEFCYGHENLSFSKNQEISTSFPFEPFGVKQCGKVKGIVLTSSVIRHSWSIF